MGEMELEKTLLHHDIFLFFSPQYSSLFFLLSSRKHSTITTIDMIFSSNPAYLLLG